MVRPHHHYLFFVFLPRPKSESKRALYLSRRDQQRKYTATIKTLATDSSNSSGGKKSKKGTAAAGGGGGGKQTATSKQQHKNKQHLPINKNTGRISALHKSDDYFEGNFYINVDIRPADDKPNIPRKVSCFFQRV